jgi:hypothetical protein
VSSRGFRRSGPPPETDPFQPSVALLSKLGSILVHAEEGVLDEGGHHFDLIVLRDLIADPEVVAWRQSMDRLAMLPVKRKP